MTIFLGEGGVKIIQYQEEHKIFKEAFRKFLEKEVVPHIEEWQKTFITNGINCDLVGDAAKDPTGDNPHKVIDLYLVEAGTAGFEKGKQI